MDFLSLYKVQIILLIAGGIFALLLRISYDAAHKRRIDNKRYREVNKPKLKALLGTWYEYHFTTEHGASIFREEEWTIELQINGEITILTRDRERDGLIYLGNVIAMSENFILIVMKGKEHEEEYYVRMEYPIPNTEAIAFGIHLGVDFDKKFYSTIYMFSRKRLAVEHARKLVKDKLIKCCSEYSLKLKN